MPPPLFVNFCLVHFPAMKLLKQLWIVPAALAMLTIVSSALGQLSPTLPRNSDKLIARAQQFWTKMAAGQKASSLEFILPEMQDAFLASTQSPIKDAKVLGLELSSDAQRATLRVRITAQTPLLISSQPLIINSQWIWKKNNWYVDIRDSSDLAKKFFNDPSDAEVPAMTAKEISDSLSLKDTFDIGTVMEGKSLTFDVGVKYTGRDAILLTTVPSGPFIRTFIGGDGITSKTDKFQLIVDTTEKYGEFSLPIQLRFFRGTIFVDRTLTVKGNVFSPITFRSPAEGTTRTGVPYTVFVRNNTDTALTVQYFQIEGDSEIVKFPEVLEPNQEAELVLRPNSNNLPDHLLLLLREVTSGRNQFIYHFHHGS